MKSNATNPLTILSGSPSAEKNIYTYITESFTRRRTWIILLFVTLIGYYSIHDGEFGGIVGRALSDAYFQVTSFVAATLALFLFLERKMNLDAVGVMNKSRFWEVPLASLLGAMPGCGGAVIVVTQYVKNKLSFGALLATLTATMGDAAFLLIAREPLTGLAIICLGVTVGIVTGSLVNVIHGRHFMRGDQPKKTFDFCPTKRRLNLFDKVWIAVIIPGVSLGILDAIQVDFSAFPIIGPWLRLFGIGGVLLCLLMFILFNHEGGISDTDRNDDGKAQIGGGVSLIDDTNFVTAWVVLAFLIYEIGIYAFDIDLATIAQASAPIVPLIAILVGFLPGCGPQILLVTLYLSGVMPVSGLVGNAISNDGDALFPAIALAPKAAIVATLYSAIPALIIAYGYFFLFE